MAVVLPARMFKDSFAKRGFAPVVFVALRGSLRDPKFGFDTLEQLLRLYGGSAGRCDGPLCSVRRFQSSKPAFGDRFCVCQFQDATNKGGLESGANLP